MFRFGLRRPPRTAPATTRSIGADKEQLADAFLQRQGLRLVTRNYRCRLGEIDLVMRDGDILVFVEVRYRASERFGTPAETVGPGKRRRLIAAATHYLQRHPLPLPCRFDVLAIHGEERIDWIREAFYAE